MHLSFTKNTTCKFFICFMMFSLVCHSGEHDSSESFTYVHNLIEKSKQAVVKCLEEAEWPKENQNYLQPKSDPIPKLREFVGFLTILPHIAMAKKNDIWKTPWKIHSSTFGDIAKAFLQRFSPIFRHRKNHKAIAKHLFDEISTRGIRKKQHYQWFLLFSQRVLIAASNPNYIESYTSSNVGLLEITRALATGDHYLNHKGFIKHHYRVMSPQTVNSLSCIGLAKLFSSTIIMPYPFSLDIEEIDKTLITKKNRLWLAGAPVKNYTIDGFEMNPILCFNHDLYHLNSIRSELCIKSLSIEHKGAVPALFTDKILYGYWKEIQSNREISMVVIETMVDKIIAVDIPNDLKIKYLQTIFTIHHEYAGDIHKKIKSIQKKETYISELNEIREASELLKRRADAMVQAGDYDAFQQVVLSEELEQEIQGYFSLSKQIVEHIKKHIRVYKSSKKPGPIKIFANSITAYQCPIYSLIWGKNRSIPVILENEFRAKSKQSMCINFFVVNTKHPNWGKPNNHYIQPHIAHLEQNDIILFSYNDSHRETYYEIENLYTDSNWYIPPNCIDVVVAADPKAPDIKYADTILKQYSDRTMQYLAHAAKAFPTSHFRLYQIG